MEVGSETPVQSVELRLKAQVHLVVLVAGQRRRLLQTPQEYRRQARLTVVLLWSSPAAPKPSASPVATACEWCLGFAVSGMLAVQVGSTSWYRV
jgi:hypothetical protein